MVCILSQDPSSLTAWGPTSHPGHPSGAVGGGLETEAAPRNQLQLSTHSPTTTTQLLCLLIAALQDASCLPGPRWVPPSGSRAPWKASQFSSSPTDPAALGWSPWCSDPLSCSGRGPEKV